MPPTPLLLRGLAWLTLYLSLVQSITWLLLK